MDDRARAGRASAAGDGRSEAARERRGRGEEDAHAAQTHHHTARFPREARHPGGPPPLGFADGRHRPGRCRPRLRRALPRRTGSARAGRGHDRPGRARGALRRAAAGARHAGRGDPRRPRGALGGRSRRRHRRPLLRIRDGRIAAGRGDRRGLDGGGRPEPRHVAARPRGRRARAGDDRLARRSARLPGRVGLLRLRERRWRTPSASRSRATGSGASTA